MLVGVVIVFPVVFSIGSAFTRKETALQRYSDFKGHFSAQLEYVMPILYSFILVSLDNIQDHLENPFDDVGEDDYYYRSGRD